ncbi:MAG: rod shape-determining protein MreD [Bacteroidetes bacterium]|nr:rod shape-determining protein MreD [Bacteroidota bacterium]MBX7128092.1 rod shape-determining protein MreD [Flavobacteriales bacterium]
MIGTLTNNLARFIILVLLQVFLLDHVDLANGWVVPYLYLLFLLMLPLDLPLWAGLILGFGTGMVMDLFSSTPGLHATACTVMMYGRALMLRALAPREGYDQQDRATITRMGLAWFVTYAGILILLHHLALFFLEVYRFNGALVTLARAFASTLATLLLCLLTQLLISRQARPR